MKVFSQTARATHVCCRTLDVAAALGSDTAYAILEAAGHTDYKIQ